MVPVKRDAPKEESGRHRARRSRKPEYFMDPIDLCHERRVKAFDTETQRRTRRRKARSNEEKRWYSSEAKLISLAGVALSTESALYRV